MQTQFALETVVQTQFTLETVVQRRFTLETVVQKPYRHIFILVTDLISWYTAEEASNYAHNYAKK